HHIVDLQRRRVHNIKVRGEDQIVDTFFEFVEVDSHILYPGDGTTHIAANGGYIAEHIEGTIFHAVIERQRQAVSFGVFQVIVGQALFFKRPVQVGGAIPDDRADPAAVYLTHLAGNLGVQRHARRPDVSSIALLVRSEEHTTELQ